MKYLSWFIVMTLLLPRYCLAARGRFCFLARRSTSNISINARQPSKWQVYLAVGSNLGDRFVNIETGLSKLCNSDNIRLVRTSFLHETAPMYLADQPSFLNGVVEIETTLEPLELLDRIKSVERDLGRNMSGIRNGPRPVDLDIIFYGRSSGNQTVLENDRLSIPHPRLQEREFVLAPLMDLGATGLMHPILNRTVGQLLQELVDSKPLEAVRVLPLPRGRMLYFNQTLVMGILNVTPDSFSDGGKYQGEVHLALKQAMKMIQDGASMIDIGGESTRPNAKPVTIEEELRRTIPVIERLRESNDQICISIDTRQSRVARAAIEAGADIVNDVSGGLFDPDMLSTVADLQVPMVIMHMRGTPETMQTMCDYDNVVEDVASALSIQAKAAETVGIHRWQQIIDPGIGFSKDSQGNLLLLQRFGRLQTRLDNIPMLLGTSRKGFIGKLTGETDPEKRDYGSMASCIAAICLGNPNGCTILRVHNVVAAKHSTLVADAVRSAR